MTDAVLDVAERFTQSLVKRDLVAVRACLSPDCRIWYNWQGDADLWTDVDGVVSILAQLFENADIFEYQNVDRQKTERGYVQTAETRTVMKNSRAAVLSICLLADVNSGVITRYREYVDGAAMAALRAPD